MTSEDRKLKILRIVIGSLKSAVKDHPDQIVFSESGLGSAAKRIANNISSYWEKLNNA